MEQKIYKKIYNIASMSLPPNTKAPSTSVVPFSLSLFYSGRFASYTDLQR